MNVIQTLFVASAALTTASAFECASDALSQSVCPSMESFYEELDGDNWVDNTNWGSSDVSVCEWFGIVCNDDDTALTGIRMGFSDRGGGQPGNNLTGQLKKVDFDSFADLDTLELGLNNLSGKVPELPGTIAALYLGFNQLTGSLKKFAQAQSDNAMIKMNFESNSINGKIPKELLSNFPNLEILSLGDNQLKGTLPDLSLAPLLKVININNNDLTCIGVEQNCATLGGRFICNLGGNDLQCDDQCKAAFTNCRVTCVPRGDSDDDDDCDDDDDDDSDDEDRRGRRLLRSLHAAAASNKAAH